ADRADRQAGKVELQDLVGRCALQRALAGADHAEAETMAEALAAEAIAGAGAIDLERGALDRLPARDAAHGRAEFVAGHFGRGEAVEADPGDAIGRVSREDAQSAQPGAAQS